MSESNKPHRKRQLDEKVFAKLDETTASEVRKILARNLSNLTGDQWAWAFLRRNEKYKKAYAIYKCLPDPIKAAVDGDGTALRLPPETSVDHLILSPRPKTARTLSEWEVECEKRGVPPLGIRNDL